MYWIRMEIRNQEIYKEYDTELEQKNAIEVYKLKIKNRVIEETEEGILTNFGAISEIFYGRN